MAKILRHVVLFSFNDGTSEADIEDIRTTFANLKGQIDGILSIETGADVSNEGLQDGFTHCFQVTWPDEEARAVFQPHPAHKAFVDKVGPHVAKVVVIDYWTEA
jgi:hypothetical protein